MTPAFVPVIFSLPEVFHKSPNEKEGLWVLASVSSSQSGL